VKIYVITVLGIELGIHLFSYNIRPIYLGMIQTSKWLQHYYNYYQMTFKIKFHTNYNVVL